MSESTLCIFFQYIKKKIKIQSLINLNCFQKKKNLSAVLPVNYNGGNLVGDDASGNDNLTYVFLRMTISNIPDGSPLMW